jgi:hypothetical protein
MNCVRFLFCFYNFIFLIIGGVLLGFGVWFAVDTEAEGILQELLKPLDDKNTTDDIVKLIEQTAYVLIGFGGFIFLLSFLGYCGAMKESKFLLGFYTFLLGLIFILEILAVCLVVFLYGPQIEEKTKEILKENLVEKYGNPGHQNFTLQMDEFMKKFQCCGINNGTDFKTIPQVCCKNSPEGIGCPPFTESNSNAGTGCYDKLKNELLSEEGRMWIIIIGVVLGLLQLIGIIFSCFTYQKVRKHEFY